MTKAIPARTPHTDALLAVLQGTPIAAEAGEVPDDVGWQGAAGTSAFVPYLVLYGLPGGFHDGSLAYPDDDATWVWQVTAVGATHNSCGIAADTARTALLTTPVTVAGRGVYRVTVDTPDAPRRDETVKPPVWISTERYRLSTTPA